MRELRCKFNDCLREKEIDVRTTVQSSSHKKHHRISNGFWAASSHSTTKKDSSIRSKIRSTHFDWLKAR